MSRLGPAVNWGFSVNKVYNFKYRGRDLGVIFLAVGQNRGLGGAAGLQGVLSL